MTTAKWVPSQPYLEKWDEQIVLHQKRIKKLESALRGIDALCHEEIPMTTDQALRAIERIVKQALKPDGETK